MHRIRRIKSYLLNLRFNVNKFQHLNNQSMTISSVKIVNSKNISRQQQPKIIKIIEQTFTQSLQQRKVALNIQKQLRQKFSKCKDQRPSVCIRRDQSDRFKASQISGNEQWDAVFRIQINYIAQRQRSASRNASRSSTPYKSLGKSPNKTLNQNQNPIWAYIVSIKFGTDPKQTDLKREECFLIQHEKCDRKKVNQGRFVEAAFKIQNS